ncbi:MAG: ATP-dependent DNA helicase RecG [Chromatiaceae bacterium]|nr:ATP-dependent DNA helicase RecG [Gammaproteobacteria bacterium]MCP5298293.1 ATP-dependent DNA helicase RecG [Chromatiaceae bacterium]MCP5423167.1 ATP-dependent DNA helicase RecG [Chromatiaceae bacterium]
MPENAATLAETPVTALKGVGPKNAERLSRLGIFSVQDLLFHLPVRYQDRTRIVPIGALRAGDQAVIQGQVELADIRYGRRRSLLVRLADGTGSILLRFFHFSATQQANMARGSRLRCFGEVRNGPQSLELVHPEVQRVDEDATVEVEQALTPIYPTTEGMHQLTWRDLTGHALALLGRGGLQELLPDAVRRDYTMPELADAVRLLHRPPPDQSQRLLSDAGHPAQRRLAFEELLAHQLSLRVLRQRQRRRGAPVLAGDGELQRRLLADLPFALTAAQQRVLAQINADLAQPHPALRLVQGDVGSGKTVVAALAALHCIEADCQAALMAPTELLAEQHLRNLAGWLEPLGVEVGWLSGRHKGRRRQTTLDRLGDGTLQLVVGTHALFQDDVVFRRLGLVIVDEQHRFGVHQRLALREKGASGQVPHQIVMTATPIPRTLAMTAYADLDLSVIDELPPGRTPVSTVVVADSRRDQVVERVALACREGRQAYWVCTLIEESEALQAQAAEDTAAALTEALDGLRIGLVHGRMKATDKEAVMAAFKAGGIDLLVATTVIEVGVDVPNASLMVIENAERLGLSQLHQLRGRVGRGAQQSHCVLMYHPPIGGIAQERLGVMRETTDGFEIARRDLEIRGPGEVLGTRQTGEMQFRIADLLRDQDMVADVQVLADRLLREHPERVAPLIRRWIGDRVHYANV